jgi:pimeloyl-ACP methyl ester carboxylesterase
MDSETLRDWTGGFPALCVGLIVFGTTVGSGAATASRLEPGPFAVGFRLIETEDRSRAVQVDSTSGGAVPRPLRIHLWYPATVEEGAVAMSSGRYAELADEDIWPAAMLGPARQRMACRRRPLARSLGDEGYQALLRQPVAAHEGAPPAVGSPPLVVLGQGLYYESPISHAALAEHLASHGLVVASCPLVGSHSPLVTLDVIDLETQVRDLEFVIATVRQLGLASSERLGAFGFDMGAMAALVLAMRNPDVDALATTDGAILHGRLPIPAAAAHHDPRQLRVPWLHATQRAFGTRPEGHQGLDLFADAVFAERYLVLADEMGHWDFTSFALIPQRAPVMGYWPPARPAEGERYAVVVDYVRSLFSAYLMDDEAARKRLAAIPDKTARELGFTVEHRPASPSPPTYSDFLNALVSADLERAERVAASLKDLDSEGSLLDEARLNRLGYHLLAGWQLADAAVLVFRLNSELYPQSANVWDSFGEGLLASGDGEAAAACFRKVLELDPGNQRAEQLLEQIEKAQRGAAPPMPQ